MIEHSVTVEKDGWAPTLAWNFVLRAGERVRNADIDEIAFERHRQQLFGTGKQWEDVFLERTAATEPVGQRTLEHRDAAAHQPTSRTLRASAKSGKSTVVNFDHPITGSIRQQSDGNCAGCGWLADGAAGKFEQIDIEPRVAVEQKEPVIEAVARMPDRAFSGVDAAYSTMRGAANPASSKTRVTPWRASSNISTSRKGIPSTSSNGFGVSAANLPSRLPRPPHKITACRTIRGLPA